MAVTASGLFLPTFQTALNNTIALDLELETHKGALFNNTITPNFNTDTAYAVAPYNANEVTGTNWAAGGVALVGTTIDITTTSGTLIYDATDVSVASTTLTNARCYLLYADVLATNNAIVLVNFTQDFSTVAGTFAITWAAPASGGVFNIDLTP